MAMTSFTWFTWVPTLMDVVELFEIQEKSNSPHEAKGDNLCPCFLGV